MSNASIENGAINGFRLHPSIPTSGVSVFKSVIAAFLERVTCVANRHSGIAVRDGAQSHFAICQIDANVLQNM